MKEFEGDTISQELVDAHLAGRLKRDWAMRLKVVPGCPRFSVNQQAALLSFICSCGPLSFGREGFSALTAGWMVEAIGASG